MSTLRPVSPSRRRATRPLVTTALAVIGAVALSGCSDTRRAIGLDRATPDEFAVVSRAPLSMPPDLALARPRPGAARPQEPTASQRAASSVFGSAAGRMSDGATEGQRAIVAQAGAKGIDPDIRTKVDEETTSLAVADAGWVESLLFWRERTPPGSIVDARKEAQRLRQAEAEGRPLNDGPVPTVERRRRALLDRIF